LLLVRIASSAALAAFLFQSSAKAQDDYDLLPDGVGKDMVYALCSGCHSIRLVAQQGLSPKRWEKMLDWMVEEQGMAELDAETHDVVMDYLTNNLNTDHRPSWVK
jgi:hypothetical protein